MVATTALFCVKSSNMFEECWDLPPKKTLPNVVKRWKWRGLASLFFFVFFVLHTAFARFWISLSWAKRQRKLCTSYPFVGIVLAMFSILWEGLPELKDKENRAPEVVWFRAFLMQSICWKLEDRKNHRHKDGRREKQGRCRREKERKRKREVGKMKWAGKGKKGARRAGPNLIHPNSRSPAPGDKICYLSIVTSKYDNILIWQYSIS